MIDLKQKIRYEYICFEQMTLATSRQNIYNKAEEICTKKQIFEQCRKMDWTEQDAIRLCTIDNLLEYIYGICLELGAVDVGKAMEEIKYRISLKGN